MIVSSFSPGESGHAANPIADLFFTTGSITLSRDGAVIGRKTNPALGYFTVPADTGRYALSVQANRDRAWSALVPQVNTAGNTIEQTVIRAYGLTK